MSIPAAASGKTLEAIRVQARRRFVLAASSMALGALALCTAALFLRLGVEVAGLTGLLLGALLLVLGVATAAHASVGIARAFPLSEALARSRRLLLVGVFLVPPAALLGSAGWLIAVVPALPVLVPVHPFFWGPVSAVAAVGIALTSLELASERMAVLAAAGAGGALALALSAGGMALADPQEALAGPRLPWDLLLLAIAFLAIAAAFERDPWAARSRRFG